MDKSKKLQIKDLVTIGIFTAIYVFINLITELISGIAPIVWILKPVNLSILCGVVFLPLMAKVQKPGAVLIMGLIPSLLYLVRGGFAFLLVITMVIFCLIGELIRKKTGFNSFKGNAVAYASFSAGQIGDFIPLWFMQDQMKVTMLEKGMPQDYVAGIEAVTPLWLLFVVFAATFILSFLGAFLAKIIMKKHLEKAGMI